MTARILMILTSNDRMGSSGKRTGFWAEEFAVPYYALVDAGAVVDVATPAGGPAPVDPGSLKPKGQNDAVVERYLADAPLQKRLQETPRVRALDASRYDAVFFPGGHGTMWDLPGNAEVRRIVEQAERSGKVIAAVCHGPAALVDAMRADGQPLVAGRRVAGFTDTEEAGVGLTDVVPFLLETRLRELGGRFERVADWQPFAVRDGRLVTGQNPASSAAVAEEVLAALA